MAKIGLKNFKYSKYDASGNLTTPTTLGKAVSCQVSVENNNAELYADNAIAESDYSFNKGTVTLAVDDCTDTVFADILGHEIDSNGEVVRKATDVAPYVALGRIVTKMVGGDYRYKVEFLSKVKFQEPSAEENTKGANVEFATTSITGTIMTLDNGEWSKTKTFESYSDADTYLTSLLTPPAQTNTSEL